MTLIYMALGVIIIMFITTFIVVFSFGFIVICLERLIDFIKGDQ